MTSAPTRRPCPLLLVLLLLLSLLVTGCSTPADTGRWSVTLISQQHHVVEERQILVGDTVVAGGTVVVEGGAEHRGSVTVLGGEARISGRVAGDLTVLGGTAALTGTAEITGDVAAAGGALTRAPGAVVRGSVTEEPSPATVLERSGQTRAPAVRALWFLAGVAVMAGLAWPAARLAPRPLHRTAAAATGFPVVSGALGTLVLIAALPLMASMIFTLFLIPVAGIVLLGLGATTVAGEDLHLPDPDRAGQLRDEPGDAPQPQGPGRVRRCAPRPLSRSPVPPVRGRSCQAAAATAGRRRQGGATRARGNRAAARPCRSGARGRRPGRRGRRPPGRRR